MATNNADNFTNPIGTSTGGTGLATLTSHAVQVGAGSSPLSQVSGSTGTVMIGTTSSDPSFSATPSVTSITFGAGTALSTYVEGTFTPTLDGVVSGSTTYTSQNGYYIKIGNLVYVQGVIVITAATGTGNATIGGLPFTVKNQTSGNTFGTVTLSASGWTWPAARTMLSTQAVQNTTTAIINGTGSAVATGILQMTNASATIIFSFGYQV